MLDLYNFISVKNKQRVQIQILKENIWIILKKVIIAGWLKKISQVQEINCKIILWCLTAKKILMSVDNLNAMTSEDQILPLELNKAILIHWIIAMKSKILYF